MPALDGALVFEPDGDGWHVCAPALKGVHTYGDAREEARRNAVEAVRVWLETAVAEGIPLPETETIHVAA